jgi:hypothetical protein
MKRGKVVQGSYGLVSQSYTICVLPKDYIDKVQLLPQQL